MVAGESLTCPSAPALSLGVVAAGVARVLRLLPNEAFERKGIHNRKGEVTLGQLVADYVAHLDDHLKFIHGKRANLGRTLA